MIQQCPLPTKLLLISRTARSQPRQNKNAQIFLRANRCLRIEYIEDFLHPGSRKKKEIIYKTGDATHIDKIGDAINIEEGAISNTCASPNKNARYNNTQQNVISLPQKFQGSVFQGSVQGFLQIGYCTYLSTMLEKKNAEIIYSEKRKNVPKSTKSGNS